MRKHIKYLLISAAIVVAGALFAAAGSADFRLARSMEILVNLFRDVSVFYVDETDSDKLLEDAAQGLMKNLDPYTEYISAEEMKDFEILTTGKYGGIGSLIRRRGDYTVIAQPYKGSPADKAGLKIGDRITAIDGTPVKGVDATRVSSMLKGDPGTPVKVTVVRLASGREETVTVIRERITIPGVPYHGFVSEGVGYIQHSDFNENSAAEVRQALMEMRSTGRLRGLILDYRGNGGGILQEAVKTLALFLPKGTQVVSMRGRTPGTNAEFRTETDPVDLELPIVVLTGSATASAAEIVAGAIQDLDRGVIAGQRTFGKGLVQSTRPVGYNAYIKVTTAKYYIPSGRLIQAIDYAHRNEDGSVSHVPDSLVREFRTQGGRRVYDGGGIMPDIFLKPDYISRFTIMTYTRGYIEDFVDELFRRPQPSIDIATFRLSDALWEEFMSFMQDKDVEFRSETSEALASLKTKAQRELRYDRIREEIARIEANLIDDKQNNLLLYRAQITELIEDEIILRHHYARGVAQHKLSSDELTHLAVALLLDPERYRAIVTSQDTVRSIDTPQEQ